MVNCQIGDLKAYVLWYIIVKLVCKLNKEEGTNSKKAKMCANFTLRQTLCSRIGNSSFLA